MFTGSHISNIGGKRHIDTVMHRAFYHPNGPVDASEIRPWIARVSIPLDLFYLVLSNDR